LTVWLALVRGFFATHRAQTPLSPRSPANSPPIRACGTDRTGTSAGRAVLEDLRARNLALGTRP
jgi:hypothetical protein